MFSVFCPSAALVDVRLFGCAVAVGGPALVPLAGVRAAAVSADIAVLPLRCCTDVKRRCFAACGLAVFVLPWVYTVAGLARHTRCFAVRTNHLFGVYVLYQNSRENTSSFGKKVRKIPKKHMKNTLLRQNSPQNPKIPAPMGKNCPPTVGSAGRFFGRHRSCFRF